MAINIVDIVPGNITSQTDLSLTLRPTTISYDRKTAFDMGPSERGSTADGLNARAWKAEVDGNSVYISRANAANTAWEDRELLFNYTGSEAYELGLTFDQVGRPLCCFEQKVITATTAAPTTSVATTDSPGWKDNEISIYWYDSALGATTITNITSGRTPRIRLDFRQSYAISESDIFLFYIRETGVYYRLQRDRFGVEYDTGITAHDDLYLEEVILATNNRLYLYFSDLTVDVMNCECLPSLKYWHSAPYPVACEIENVELGASEITSGSKRDLYNPQELVESVELGASEIVVGSKRSIVLEETIDIDSVELGASEIVEGSLRTIINEESIDTDSVELGASEITAGSKEQVIIEADAQTDSVELGASEIVSGSKETV